MEDELYEILISNLKTKLQSRVAGEVSVTKDERHFFVDIYRFGYTWHHAIYNVDLMDPHNLNSDSFMLRILEEYRNFVEKSYFK